MKYCIAMAEEKDKESLLLMMKEHAMFEGHNIEITNYKELGKLKSLPVTIFVVNFNNNIVGYMSVIKQFSTWDMDWYLYLDCLYLSEGARGQGIGYKLMNKLKAFAKENMINSIQWQTPKDNQLAIEFYQQLGAINKEKQRFLWPV